MTSLRALAVLIGGIAIAMSAVGFASQASLANGPAFAESMTNALADPTVNSEVKAEIRTEVSDGVKRAAQSGGVLGQLGSTLGADAIADQAAGLVDTEAFADAWHDWALLLHQGLANYASGRPDQSVTVSGNSIDVAVEPLLAPVIGSGIASRVSGALDFLNDNPTVTLNTDVALEPVLTSVGRLIQARWVLLAVGLLGLLFGGLAGPRRFGWLAAGLAWSALTVAAVTWVVSFSRSNSIPGATMPATGQAVVKALTQGWTANLFAVAGGLALLAVICAVLALATGGRRVTDGRSPQYS